MLAIEPPSKIHPPRRYTMTFGDPSVLNETGEVMRAMANR